MKQKNLEDLPLQAGDRELIKQAAVDHFHKLVKEDRPCAFGTGLWMRKFFCLSDEDLAKKYDTG